MTATVFDIKDRHREWEGRKLGDFESLFWSLSA